MDNIFNVIKQFVSLRTVSGREDEIKRCMVFLKRKFEKKFLVKKNSFRERPILVLSNTVKKDVDFIISGHIDVVPARDSDFRVKIKKDKIFGRGTNDMKGPLSASILAAKDSMNDISCKFAIFITSDEETDGLSTKYLLDKQGYKARFAILPDGGSSTAMVVKQKGFLQFRVLIKGKSVHASRPWEAKNPIETGFDLYTRLQKKFPVPKCDSDWKTSIVLTKVEAGKAINQIPEEAAFFFDARYINEKDKRKILQETKKFLKGCKFSVSIVAENGLFRVSEDNFHLKRLKETAESVTGKRVYFVSESGTGDAVFFAQKGIPSVLYKPDGGNSHADNEWVSRKGLFDFYRILKEFLSRAN